MPVFFFHLSGRGSYRRDEDGITFASLDEAYIEAYHAALDISFDMLRNRIDPNGHAFEITDESGTRLLDVPFAEVLHPRPHRLPSLSQDFHDTLRSRLARSRTLRSDLLDQVSVVRETIANTKILLQRSRTVTG